MTGRNPDGSITLIMTGLDQDHAVFTENADEVFGEIYKMPHVMWLSLRRPTALNLTVKVDIGPLLN